MKGTRPNLYGWIVLPGRDVAYEYTTNARGEVVVAKVRSPRFIPSATTTRQAIPRSTDGAPCARAQTHDPPHVGAYNGQDTTKLQSQPGAKKVLFMDMAVLTLDKAELWKAWQTVASAYSAFDVNVTTDKAVYDAAGVTNSGKGVTTTRPAARAAGSTRSAHACCNHLQQGQRILRGDHQRARARPPDGPEPRRRRTRRRLFRRLSRLQMVPIMGSNIPKTDWGDKRSFNGARANTRAPRKSRTTWPS